MGLCTLHWIPPGVIGRVDGFLPKPQVEVCVLCFHLVSRWCHKISTVLQLSPAPLRTVLAQLTHTAPRKAIHRLEQTTLILGLGSRKRFSIRSNFSQVNCRLPPRRFSHFFSNRLAA